MKVLVTGHNGYIGSVMVTFLQVAGYEVVGLDNYMFEDCAFGKDVPDVMALRMDVRDVEVSDLEGFDAVIHLAGISNDPLGNLYPEITYAINHEASVRLAWSSKRAGVSRFLFSSSCSLYGVSDDAFVTEEASFSPVSPYGRSKALVERDLSKLADDDFSPTFLRNGTAYGTSPRLRSDLVINNLTGFACTTGQILIKTDGSAWRPLVHVEDISRAFLMVLEAPRELIHDETFNVGITEENYRVRDVAEIVEGVVQGTKVFYANNGVQSLQCYRVDCSKLVTTFPDFQPQWTVQRGVEELFEAYLRYGLTFEDFARRFQRIEHVKKLMQEQRLDHTLRWQQTVPFSSEYA